MACGPTLNPFGIVVLGSLSGPADWKGLGDAGGARHARGEPPARGPSPGIGRNPRPLEDEAISCSGQDLKHLSESEKQLEEVAPGGEVGHRPRRGAKEGPAGG